MIRKFAMLAAASALFVACSSNVEEKAADTMDAANQQATQTMNEAQNKVEDAAAKVDSAAKATVDTAKAVVTEAAKQVTK